MAKKLRSPANILESTKRPLSNSKIQKIVLHELKKYSTGNRWQIVRIKTFTYQFPRVPKFSFFKYFTSHSFHVIFFLSKPFPFGKHSLVCCNIAVRSSICLAHNKMYKQEKSPQTRILVFTLPGDLTYGATPLLVVEWDWWFLHARHRSFSQTAGIQSASQLFLINEECHLNR